MIDVVDLRDRYELGAVIGRGSSATVHRARDRTTRTPVAVKLFHGPGRIAFRSPEREMAVVSGLRHPGLVRLHAAGRVQGRPAVVMDLVDGRTLADELRAGPLPPLDVAVLGARLGDALAHVHRNGVVHRDVKPGNILIDRSGRPHLTDFGLACAIATSRATGIGEIVGTPAYMAPEQVTGTAVGPSADVYALGLVLLEAVTGAREFEGDLVECALARLLRAPRVPASVAAPLDHVLRSMTATEPCDRPTAAQVTHWLCGASSLGSGEAAPDVGRAAG